MSATTEISQAESAVMEVLWSHSPAACEEVVRALEGRQDWREGTIKTLLNRLLKKGAVRVTKHGRRYLYSPVLARDQWLLSQSKALLDRLFGGRVAPLVAYFGRHRKLTKKDIADLKRLIEELGNEP